MFALSAIFDVIVPRPYRVLLYAKAWRDSYFRFDLLTDAKNRIGFRSISPSFYRISHMQIHWEMILLIPWTTRHIHRSIRGNLNIDNTYIPRMI